MSFQFRERLQKYCLFKEISYVLHTVIGLPMDYVDIAAFETISY